MEKNFNKWNDKKIIINKKNVEKIFFKEREIWFCNVGLNIGVEQDGKGDDFLRPVLILKKFNTKMFLAIPLTKSNSYNKFCFKLSSKSYIIISQIKLLDSKRLYYKTNKISLESFKIIKQKIKEIIL